MPDNPPAGNGDSKPKHHNHDGNGDHNGGGPDINKQVMAAQYGFALAFMNSNPELKALFDKAVKGTWTADKFIAQLRDTDWFKHHSANVRNAIMQETSDPATYAANVNQMVATVRDTWGSMFGAAGMNEKQIHAWAETAQRMGWSQAQLVDHMTASLNYSKMLRSNALGGKAAQVQGQLQALASQYGVDLGDKWRASQFEKVMEGTDTVEGVQQRVRDLAMREYKAFADRIAAGETVQDIADPYMQKMASLLELNPNDIGLKDKMIQAALKQTTPDGKPAAMDLHTFEDFVRKDARWQYTDNAREQVSGLTANLLQSFGLMAGG
ncbi:MAG: hypothetical protein ACXVXY_03665 [Mycobacteriaceae bacterium]